MEELKKEAMTKDERVGIINWLAAQAGTKAPHGFVSSTARMVMLHYELVTVEEEPELTVHDREDDYNYLKSLGYRLGGSAYAIPVPTDRTILKFASELWNQIHDNLSGRMVAGDIVIIQWPADNRLGLIAKCVPDGETSLGTVPIPKD